MIHDLVLPTLTEERLHSILQLQMILLEFAVLEPKPNLDTYEECAKHLDKHEPFTGYGVQIASSLWHRHKKDQEPKLVILLKKISSSFRASDDPRPEFNDSAFKNNWLKRICREIENLESFDENELGIYYFYGNGKEYMEAPTKRQTNSSLQKEEKEKKKKVAPLWQQAIGDFFLYFYTTYLEKSGNSFPAKFFPFASSDEFGRQALLKAFREDNNGLYTFAVCDKNSYFTEINNDITLEKGIYRR